MNAHHSPAEARFSRHHEDTKGRVSSPPGLADNQSLRMSAMNPPQEVRRTPHKLVLCFDGTGNKFRGDDSDSNILKIYRCLDREAGNQCMSSMCKEQSYGYVGLPTIHPVHYYQPGIGTYVVSNSLSHTTLSARIRSWYLKAKDSAVGSSFDQHVVGGYRFLMRFYTPGDEIYFFGFSRGACEYKKHVVSASYSLYSRILECLKMNAFSKCLNISTKFQR